MRCLTFESNNTSNDCVDCIIPLRLSTVWWNASFCFGLKAGLTVSFSERTSLESQLPLMMGFKACIQDTSSLILSALGHWLYITSATFILIASTADVTCNVTFSSSSEDSVGAEPLMCSSRLPDISLILDTSACVWKIRSSS